MKVLGKNATAVFSKKHSGCLLCIQHNILFAVGFNTSPFRAVKFLYRLEYMVVNPTIYNFLTERTYRRVSNTNKGWTRSNQLLGQPQVFFKDI